MVFEVKYDPANNVKFVKCVEKYPKLYNFWLSGSDKDKEWEKVAVELNSTVLFCRDRWTSLLGCYKRYLRHKAEKIMKRPYYLAEHMEFVRPYVNIKFGSCIKNGADIQSDHENDDNMTITTIADDLEEHSLVMEECNDSPLANPLCILIDSSDDEGHNICSEDSVNSIKNEHDNDETDSSYKNEGDNDETDYSENENPDLNFFKSLLPDIQAMTSQQQLRFRKEVLNAIDMTLYSKDLTVCKFNSAEIKIEKE